MDAKLESATHKPKPNKFGTQIRGAESSRSIDSKFPNTESKAVHILKGQIFY